MPNMSKSDLKIKHTSVFTKNYKAFLDPEVRFITNTGGSRSSKTYSISQILIWYALTTPKKTISVVRKTFPALAASVLVDFMTVLDQLDIYNYFSYNKMDHRITFHNGSTITFFSVDNPQKLRGRKHDVVFCNEANELKYDDFYQINMRTTGKIIIDWNPSDAFSWIFDLMKDEKCVNIHSTYKDNPFLEPAIVRELDELVNKDETYYQIYALGIPAHGREKVFTNWKQGEFPKDLQYFYGMDFGWNDPTSIVQCAYRDGHLYLKEILYESYLRTPELVKMMQSRGVSKEHEIFADSARPDIIADLVQEGFWVSKANKKIEEGIQWMRSNQLVIDPASTNLIQELSNYNYKKIHEKVTDVPVDFFNHAIDAARYASIEFKNTFKPAVY